MVVGFFQEQLSLVNKQSHLKPVNPITPTGTFDKCVYNSGKSFFQNISVQLIKKSSRKRKVNLEERELLSPCYNYFNSFMNGGLLSYRNQSKDWFLFDRELRHEELSTLNQVREACALNLTQQYLQSHPLLEKKITSIVV